MRIIPDTRLPLTGHGSLYESYLESRRSGCFRKILEPRVGFCSRTLMVLLEDSYMDICTLQYYLTYLNHFYKIINHHTIPQTLMRPKKHSSSLLQVFTCRGHFLPFNLKYILTKMVKFRLVLKHLSNPF